MLKSELPERWAWIRSLTMRSVNLERKDRLDMGR